MTEVEKCRKCGKSIDDTHPYSRCDECDEPLTEAAKQSLLKWPAADARAGSPVLNRYRDAYQVGRSLMALGEAIKIGGASMVGMALLGGWSWKDELGASPMLMVLLLAAICGLFWAGGVVVCALAQIVLATLDGAVARSRFLSDPERLAALGFPRTIADRVISPKVPTMSSAPSLVLLIALSSWAPDVSAASCSPDGCGTVKGSVKGLTIAPIRAFQASVPGQGTVIVLEEAPGDCNSKVTAGAHLVLMFCNPPAVGTHSIVDSSRFSCPTNAAGLIEKEGRDFAITTGGTVTITGIIVP